MYAIFSSFSVSTTGVPVSVRSVTNDKPNAIPLKTLNQILFAAYQLPRHNRRNVHLKQHKFFNPNPAQNELNTNDPLQTKRNSAPNLQNLQNLQNFQALTEKNCTRQARTGVIPWTESTIPAG